MNPPKPSRKVVAAVVFVIVGGSLLGIGVGRLTESKGHRSADSRVQPAISITASQLFQDYSQNEVRADQLYKGKQLAVLGTVLRVKKDFSDKAFVELEGPDSFHEIYAPLRSDQMQTAANLSKGDRITLECVGDGLFNDSPVLQDCIIPSR